MLCRKFKIKLSITHDLLVANKWYRYNSMIINENKLQAIVLGTTDHTFSSAVKPSIDVFVARIDNKFCFDNHIFAICKKINNQFSLMLRLHKLISKWLHVKTIHTFLLPHFQYCFTVWHHCGAEKLEALTKRILTLLQDYSSSYNQLLDKVNLNFLCLWVYAYVKKRWYNRGGSWKFHEQNVLPRNVNKVFLFKFK